LEDDATLGEALKEAFTRDGYEVFISGNGNDVTEYISKNTIQALIVDCLLPGESGVDYVAGLRKKYPASILDVILMSGLFTDAGFVKDSLRSTQALAFLKKPFELSEITKLVKPMAAGPGAQDVEVSPRKALYLLFNKPKVTLREKRRAIEALEEIHGFDLPFLYSLLVETQATGHLNIVGEKGEVSGISFSQGKIVAVDIVDQETFLGKLLLEAGYIHPDDLNEALNVTSSKRLGERLIQGNLLSPHAFNIALANQMSIRLSRTIVDAKIKVNFVATEVELTHPHVDSEALTVFLHDWIASKITPAWLKAHYLQWGDYGLYRSPSLTMDHPILKMPLLANFSGIVDYFTKGNSLNQAMEGKKFPEETAYKALHLLLTKGFMVFSEKPVVVDSTERLKTLKKLWAQLSSLNKLEALDLMARVTASSESEPQMVYEEFKKILGPEPSPKEKELAQVFQQLKKLTDEVYTFSKSGNRDRMREEIAKSEVEMKMKAASQYDDAKNLLQKSQFSSALTILNKVSVLEPNMEKLRLYMSWARLASVDSQSAKAQRIKEVEMDLMQVPPEEKYDALFSFVMGLLSKAKGDVSAAKKYFEKATHLDANFLPPRRELAQIQSRQAPQKDMMNRDLKDLVSGFFKKK
jgi:FixJ family two-component response regulator